MDVVGEWEKVTDPSNESEDQDQRGRSKLKSTEAGKKKSCVAVCGYWVITAIDFVFELLLFFWPLFIAVAVPEILSPYWYGGTESHKIQYILLMSLAYVVVAINTGFAVWFFWKKGFRSNVFKNSAFSYWVWITNFLLVCGIVIIFCQPLYFGHGKMGN